MLVFLGLFNVLWSYCAVFDIPRVNKSTRSHCYNIPVPCISTIYLPRHISCVNNTTRVSCCYIPVKYKSTRSLRSNISRVYNSQSSSCSYIWRMKNKRLIKCWNNSKKILLLNKWWNQLFMSYMIFKVCTILLPRASTVQSFKLDCAAAFESLVYIATTKNMSESQLNNRVHNWTSWGSELSGSRDNRFCPTVVHIENVSSV
jgi:hypothetical protein